MTVESHAADASSASKQVLGELVGDRPCAACGFNLSGQSITRDPQYRLLIVRCPECGTGAALMEYPLLGRWANRLGYLLVALYLLVVLAMMLGSAGITFGMSMGANDMLSQRFTLRLTQIQQDRANANVGPQPANWSWQSNYQKDREWWESSDKWQLFQEAGGFATGVNWYGLVMLVFIVLVVTPMGMLFAVAMPHLRGWRRLCVPVVVFCFGMLYLFVAYLTQRSQVWFYPQWSGPQVFQPIVVPTACALGSIVLMFGMLVGRPVARWVLVLILPPRLRAPMGFLWRADGLTMPRTGG